MSENQFSFFTAIVTSRKDMWKLLQFWCYYILELILVADLKKALYPSGFVSAGWIWETSLVLIYCVVIQLEKTINRTFSCHKPHCMPLSHSKFMKNRSVWLPTRDTGIFNYVKCSVSSVADTTKHHWKTVLIRLFLFWIFFLSPISSPLRLFLVSPETVLFEQRRIFLIKHF